MSINYNKNNCFSIKKKGSKEQCNRKRKDGTHFCGIHNRAKNVTYFVNIASLVDVPKVELNNDLSYYLKEELLAKYGREGVFVNPFIFGLLNEMGNMEWLMDLSNNTLKVGKLRNTLKHYNLLSFIKKNQSKRKIFSALINYLEWEGFYIKNVDKIVGLQASIRGYFVRKRRGTVNYIECIQLINIFEIPISYYHKLCDCGKSYSFDLRTLNNLFQEGEFDNPYTMNRLSEDEIDIAKRRIEYLVERGKFDDFEKKPVNPEMELEFEAVEVFRRFDLIGNYTNYKWFMNLGAFKLRDLYYKTEDMVNYRINLSINDRKKYFDGGISFPIKMGVINQITEINKIRSIILNEYKKILDFDNNIEDKKTAVMWLLIALTEVSNDAKIALPFLNMDLYG